MGNKKRGRKELKMSKKRGGKRNKMITKMGKIMKIENFQALKLHRRFKINKKISEKRGTNQVKKQGRIGAKLGRQVSKLGSILGFDTENRSSLSLQFSRIAGSGKKIGGRFPVRNLPEKKIIPALNKPNSALNIEGKTNRNNRNNHKNRIGDNHKNRAGNGRGGTRIWDGGSFTKLPFKIILTLTFILLIGVMVFVSALSDDNKTALQDELSQLESNLTSQGYGWLIDYNITYPQVNVYRENSNDLLAQFPTITSGKYQIFLTNLSENESYSTFDLKSIGDVRRINCDILLKKMRIDELKKVIEK